MNANPYKPFTPEWRAAEWDRHAAERYANHARRIKIEWTEMEACRWDSKFWASDLGVPNETDREVAEAAALKHAESRWDWEREFDIRNGRIPRRWEFPTALAPDSVAIFRTVLATRQRDKATAEGSV